MDRTRGHYVTLNSQTQGDKYHFSSLCGNNKRHSKVVVSLLGTERVVGGRERDGEKSMDAYDLHVLHECTEVLQ